MLPDKEGVLFILEKC